MIRELKYFIFVLTIFIFFFVIGKYYFSDQNKKNSYRSINELEQEIDKFSDNLVILKNNTKNIIEYMENDNNKKKRNITFGNCYQIMISERRAFIIGIKGTKLKNREILFLKKFKPWGVILFSRNINTISQTQELTNHIKKIFKDKYYPILIDEEDGRVSRLRKFIDNSVFSADFFGKLLIKDKKKFNIYFDVYVKQIGHLLNILGININTVPVLDVRRKITNKIIGNRSYSSKAKIVSKIGKFCISNFHKQRIATIIKHIPGHGLAKVDSHKKLPIVNKSLREMNKIDFFPFKNNKSLLAMTAHIMYSKIDKNNTATHSKKVIKLIRKKIGYKNLLLSDDISMNALKYSITENTIRAFNAGCNLVLHCNANYSEMLQVANNSPIINNFVIKKTSQFINIIR